MPENNFSTRALVPQIMHFPTNPIQPKLPQGTGWQGFKEDLFSAGRMIKDLLVGNPEATFDPSQSWVDWKQIGDKDGLSMNVPTPGGRALGTADLTLAAIPFLGGARDIIAGMRKPFYSALERTIVDRAPNQAFAEDFLNIAKKGSKAEELNWTGLGDWLKNQEGTKIKKQDVLGYLRANYPDLHEKIIGGPNPPARVVPANTITPNLEGFYAVNQTGEPLHELPLSESDARLMGIKQSNASNKPKFTQYTLPGGENHRELVVTMPAKANDGANLLIRKNDRGGFELIDTNEDAFIDNFPTQEEAEAERARMIAEPEREIGTSGEQAAYGNNYLVPPGHAYGDPKLDVNRLFHARMNDRDGGKTLHLEELQSDWHQAGKSQGYAANKLDPKIEDRIGELLSLDSDRGLNTEERNELIELERQNNKDAVPDAPFKNTWHELGMKRMLQEAADGGYDRLTWTTGEQQRARWNQELHEHVDKLVYDGNSLVGYKNGEKVVDAVMNNPADLESYVGKDMAKRLSAKPKYEIKSDGARFEIFNDKGETYGSYPDRETAAAIIKSKLPNTASLEGLDIDVGDKFMRTLYDQKMPQFARDYAKKWGGKVEQRDLPVGRNEHDYTEKVWSIEITPQMRKALKEDGQPTFNVAPPIPRKEQKSTRDLPSPVRKPPLLPLD